MGKVIIIMGSASDQEFVGKITKNLDELKVEYQAYVASAHKNPKKF